MSRVVNLIFQGGGVRGIAYAGVLSKMPTDIRIAGVGGTSAGSLVAALLAVGKRGDDLRAVLSDRDLYGLLRKEDVERRERLIAISQKYLPQLQALISESTGLQPPKAWRFLFSGTERERVHKLFNFWKSASTDLGAWVADFKAIWSERGLHSSEPLRQWLGRVLENVRFEDLVNVAPDGIPDLRIVAANVSTQSYEVITAERPRGFEYVADAVHASVSIPGFFRPLAYGPSRVLVDGGILSNFPSFLFAQSSYPTIGFRLEDVPPLTRVEEIQKRAGEPLPIQKTVDYLLLLLKTMAEAHDSFRDLPEDFHAYSVPVPADIRFDKFDLSVTDVDRLFDKAASIDVKWDRDSAQSATPPTYDPRPYRALAFAIGQGQALTRLFYARDMWVESLEQQVVLIVTVERDGTSHYKRTMRLKVGGKQPLVAMRAYAVGLPKTASSLVENVPDYHEKLAAGTRPVILIPSSNEAEQKGFLAFFDPPIRESDPVRTFESNWTIEKEYAKVLRGESGPVSYSVRQIAHRQHLTVEMEVRVAKAFGGIRFESDVPSQFEDAGEHGDPATGTFYHRYTRRRYSAQVEERVSLDARFRRL